MSGRAIGVCLKLQLALGTLKGEVEFMAAAAATAGAQVEGTLFFLRCRRTSTNVVQYGWPSQ